MSHYYHLFFVTNIPVIFFLPLGEGLRKHWNVSHFRRILANLRVNNELYNF
jgi:hypothetical protein